MPTILIKNARVLAGENRLIKQDVLIKNTYIKQVADTITVSADQVIDAENALLLPGLIDVHVHFREPGFAEKETVVSGSKAAARGGFTTVLAMPNVNPVVDNPDVLRQMLALNQRDGIVKIHQYAAISAGLDSDHVDDLDALAQAGAVAFTNDGKGVQTADTMYEAMKAAARLGKVLVAHVEDDSLIHGGVMNAGPAADALGLPGANKLSESSQLARDLVIAQATGVRYHVAHVSTAESVALIRIAKKEGVHVTAEVSPHHLLLDDGMITKDDAMMKMNPPLRLPHDRAALIAGLLDGTIDMVATDHAPHTAAEKAQGMLKAPNGVTGIETSFQLLYTHFVKSGVMSLRRLLQVMNQAPAAAFSLSDAAVKVAAGQKADLALFDIDHSHIVSKDEFASKGSNSPFIGWEIYGQTQATWVNGRQVYAAERSQT